MCRGWKINAQVSVYFRTEIQTVMFPVQLASKKIAKTEIHYQACEPQPWIEYCM
jgi:hypothetical protein